MIVGWLVVLLFLLDLCSLYVFNGACRYCMKGSTVDAMADGVDHAALVLFGVSRAYKESANCRLELT